MSPSCKEVTKIVFRVIFLDVALRRHSKVVDQFVRSLFIDMFGIVLHHIIYTVVHPCITKMISHDADLSSYKLPPRRT